MENVLPAYEQLTLLEHETLNLLYSYLCQWPTLSHLAGFVQKFQNNMHPSQFRMMIYWSVDYKGKGCRIFLGEVFNKQGHKKKDSKISDMSSYMCIVKGIDKPEKVLRKFHFDYVTERADRRESHPRFHLQYCGGLPPEMEALGITDRMMKPLEPEVDGPRILFSPMTLGLLMNIAFYEFPCNDTEEIRKRGEWQNLVRKNVKTVLLPFYDRCKKLAGKEDINFFDEVYVK